ncbi:MAG: ABC transporter ATP-binding protein [Gammaproteobacteria bacterium]|nr:ABC transporter ATP-binding protein [Gammaproteobacteria bacterium]
MSDVLLSVRGLKAGFGTGHGALRAVDGVSFEIKRGETFALLGESGCGKTMTALSLMRLLPEPGGRILEGEMRLDGRDLLRLPEMEMRAVRGRRIAMIFQEPMTSLNPVLSVGEQIGEVLRLHFKLRGRALRSRVLELLEAVGLPDPPRRSREYPHQLSGGMKQRAMIAMALAGEPQLLIADEPTTALDVTLQAQVLELLRSLQRDTGMAVLLITHDLGVVAQMADRVAVMYAGQIVEAAARRPFIAEPRHPYSRKLFESLPAMDKRAGALAVIPGAVPALTQAFQGCRFAARCDFAWDACREREPVWIALDGGGVRCHLADPALTATRPQAGVARVAAAARPSRPVPATGRRDGALLDVEGLEVHFPIHAGVLKRVVGRVRAVDGVTLHIGAGRTLALVGESGCGKTTVGKGILQLIRPTAGRVRFDGVDLTALRGETLRKRRAQFQIIFQDPYSSMNPRMPIGAIVEEGMVAQRLEDDADRRRARVGALLEQVGLTPEIQSRYPHEFSGGQRQRICIARALAVNPRLLICDEPTSALDISVQAQILNLLRGLQDTLGLCYLFITHNLSVVAYLAHEVAVMYLGRIVEYGPVEDVLHRPAHPYTQALLASVPVVDVETRRPVMRLAGEPPSPAHPPRGCHFHPRCPHAMAVCRERFPERVAVSATHGVWCFLHGRQT